MLSYRHAFHAGNFADVLKHVVLTLILEHLAQKDKPFCCLDTHAGPGSYRLTGEYAQKTREYETGIGRLWLRDDLPAPLARYMELVRQINRTAELTDYPGSPYFERAFLRAGDRLLLFELHTTEIERLQRFGHDDRRIRVIYGDGLREALGWIPPHERRGLVFIDPSYEIKSDYRQVAETLIKLHRRFATGIYVIWYPVIDRRRVNQLEGAIQDSGIRKVRLFELGVRRDSREPGMTGSGLIVVNPPWVLAEQMNEVLGYLSRVLGQEGDGFQRVVELAGE